MNLEPQPYDGLAIIILLLLSIGFGVLSVEISALFLILVAITGFCGGWLLGRWLSR